ncbi:uncharacterized protein LOC126381031 [Pectinophora gossypiella]|uniref:uncharacterized protein LOC126381031 n=1 Tax=Pectinophora gossypiella TaxID=13191 RepID=UPI00214E8B34|nr:uncharacterized protein LOC126381031 [Pectinophora gossypiella]
MSQLVPLEAFDCEGDSASVGLRWEKWKRGLEIYLQASNIDKPVKQRATLLHVGGLALQDIFYNLPGASVDEDGSNNVYEIAIGKLNDFFTPKQNRFYERHIFRSIKQESNESFERFLVRLRQQSAKCKFSSEEDQIIDQTIEKCSSSELRKKLLTLGDSITLEKIVSEANAFESVERQLNEFKPSLTINKIDTNGSMPTPPACTRCGKQNHKPDSLNCPAKDKTCKKCGYVGIFFAQCRTRASKRKNKQNSRAPNKKMKTHDKKEHESKQSDNNSEIDYIFHMDNTDEDSIVKCQIGGVTTEFLIDSGSKHNIITDQTWTYLKENKIVITNQQKSPEKNFKGYASNKSLTVLGAFDAEITIGTNTQTATFYVVKDGSINLLGKYTAKSLKVLKIGLDINAIEDMSFPKFRNVELAIAIDDSVKPALIHRFL